MECLFMFWRINSMEIALRRSKAVRKFLGNAEFIANDRKPECELSKKLTWLGIEIDLAKCFIPYLR